MTQLGRGRGYAEILGTVGDTTLKNWSKDLRGLTDEGVRNRLQLAIEFEQRSMARGPRRNPKAARDWRERIQQAETELDRRGLSR